MFAQRQRRAQTAVEYLLLMAIVAAVVLWGFKGFVNPWRDSSEGYYNRVTQVILGDNPTPRDGGWCPAACPAKGQCGPTHITKVCACPSPMFGGRYCEGSPVLACPDDTRPADCQDTPCTASVCQAPTPRCGETTYGFNNCGTPCERQGPVCNNCGGPAPELGEGQRVCPGTNENASGTWHTVRECTPGGQCEISCESGNTQTEPDPTGLTCMNFYCKGTQPPHTVLCTNEPPSWYDSQFSLVQDCHEAPECSVVCQEGSRLEGGACVQNRCNPEYHENACPDAHIMVPTALNGSPWRSVTDCAGAGKCSYLLCGPYQHMVGNTRCENNQCAEQRTPGTICEGAVERVPQHNMPWTSTTQCTGAPCQTLNCTGGQTPNQDRTACQCPEGQRLENGICQVYCGNGQADPGETCENCAQDVPCGNFPTTLTLRCTTYQGYGSNRVLIENYVDVQVTYSSAPRANEPFTVTVSDLLCSYATGFYCWMGDQFGSPSTTLNLSSGTHSIPVGYSTWYGNGVCSGNIEIQIP